MHWRIAMVLGLTSAAASMASATEVVRRAPVQLESTGHEYHGEAHGVAHGHSAFPGSTGCCETQAGCCDNVWAGYCGSRKLWCNKSTCKKSACQPRFRQHRGCTACGGAKKGCNHCGSLPTQKTGFVASAQKGHFGWAKGGKGGGCFQGGCGFAFGLVAPAPCGTSCGKSKGSCHSPSRRVSGWKFSMKRPHEKGCGCSSCGGKHWRQTYAPGPYYGHHKSGCNHSGGAGAMSPSMSAPTVTPDPAMQYHSPQDAAAPTEASGSANELAPASPQDNSAILYRFGAFR